MYVYVVRPRGDPRLDHDGPGSVRECVPEADCSNKRINMLCTTYCMTVHISVIYN